MDFSDNSFSEPISFHTKPRGFGKRHTLALLGFFGFALSYSLRFNLSIAIVAMVNTPPSSQQSQNPEEIMFRVDVCERNLKPGNNSSLDDLTYKKISKRSLKEEELSGEFNWSESQQGFILGSFFWGYLLTQIPGGWLGHRFGGKWPFGLGLLCTGILAIATPWVARVGGYYAIVGVRIMQGAAGGVTVPCMHTLLARWIPPEERGKLTAIVYAGIPFGNAVSLISSGYIIHYFGWPFVFYGTGVVTIVWYFAWATLTHSSPSEHPTISKKELKYIQNSVQGSINGSSSKSLPWRKIIKSGPFWAIVVAQFTETYGLYTIMTELPTYMKTVLHFDIQQNSLISALPHFLTWIVSIALTQLGDFFIERRYVSISVVRKSCNTIGMWGAAAALLGVAYSGCDRTITVALLSLGIACTGGIYGGVLVNLIDIAPNFAGILMGISNTSAAIPGFLAPWIAGLIIDNDPSLGRWKLVFMITSGIYFIGNLIFLLLASGEEQEWNNLEEDKPKEDDKKTNKVHIDLSSFYESPVEDSLEIPYVIEGNAGKSQ